MARDKTSLYLCILLVVGRLWIFSFLDCFDRRVLFGIVKVMPGHHEKAGKVSLLRSQVFLFQLYLLRNQRCILIPLEFHDVWSLPSWALAPGDCAALGGRKQTNIKPSPDLDKHWYFSLGDKTVESFKTAQTSPQDPNWKSPGMFDRPKNESERKVFVSLTSGGLANQRTLGIEKVWAGNSEKWPDLGSIWAAVAFLSLWWRYQSRSVAFFAPKKSMTAGGDIFRRAGWHFSEHSKA